MGYKNWPDNERKMTHDPVSILSKAGLKPGMTFVDIGCGQGYFSIPASKLVGPKGKVIGIDIDVEGMDVLEKTASREDLDNITAVVGHAEETVIFDACADVVFFGICLHDFGDPVKVLRNAKRMLKPSGTLANFDWKKIHADRGPPYDIRFSEEKASGFINDAGFTVVSVQDIGLENYLIIAKPGR